MKIFKVIYNLMILIIFITGIIFLFKKQYFLGVVWTIITPLLLVIPKALYKLVKKDYNEKLLNTFEMFALLLLITSVGHTLYFKSLGIDFDSFSHFFNLVIYTLIFGILYYLIKTKITKKKVSVNEIMTFSFIFTLILAVILWEKFQFYGDKLFGTKMFSDPIQDPYLDSFLDQIFGTIGTITGLIILYLEFEKWLIKWKR